MTVGMNKVMVFIAEGQLNYFDRRLFEGTRHLRGATGLVLTAFIDIHSKVQVNEHAREPPSVFWIGGHDFVSRYVPMQNVPLGTEIGGL